MGNYTISQPDEVHQFRKEIDALIQKAQGAQPSREMSLVVTKLQEAKMWAGKVLEVMGSTLPTEFQDKA